MEDKEFFESGTSLLFSLNKSVSTKEISKTALDFFSGLTGADALGLRLKDGADYPYFTYSGFNDTFVRHETNLCVYDSSGKIKTDKDGTPKLECLCGSVILGKTDPGLPFFTEFGSFWSNSTTKLLASSAAIYIPASTRNRCNSEGFESMALIPLKSKFGILGLIQINSKKTEFFTSKSLSQFEKYASFIASAFERELNTKKESGLAPLKLIADTTYDWEWYYSGNTFIYVSPSCEIHTGYTQHQFLTNPALLKQITNDDDKTAIDAMLNTSRTNDIIGVKFRIRTSSGDVRWIECLSKKVCPENGSEAGIRGSARDITQRILAEQQMEQSLRELKRSNSDLSSFAHVVSHDLRSPAKTISLYLSMAESRYASLQDSEILQLISSAKDSAKRMNSMMEALLKYSRIGEGKMQTEATDIGSLIRTTTEDISAQIKETSAVITYSSMPVLQVDPAFIRQLFMNLIGNSLKYSFAKPPEIRITCTEQSGSHLFCVEDNGSGFEQRFAEKAFEVFARFHNDPAYDGSGMGLAICKKIVNLHGGRIWITTSPGQGTKVYFTLT